MYHQPAHLSRATLTSHAQHCPLLGVDRPDLFAAAVAGHEVAVVVAVVVVVAELGLFRPCPSQDADA
ncbi:hypothetical protein Syun_001372 [Stephania yunnanensis]|uniref:Uncharacterized protein n=1 Tax=Stephania yunnanensis TaxID=152371 RepID=A0AAP0LFH3_9MAGN